jgi:hypothetical protein
MQIRQSGHTHLALLLSACLLELLASGMKQDMYLSMCAAFPHTSSNPEIYNAKRPLELIVICKRQAFIAKAN